jgi:hypothetical protein
MLLCVNEKLLHEKLLACHRSNTYGEAIAGDTKGPAERREV